MKLKEDYKINCSAEKLAIKAERESCEHNELMYEDLNFCTYIKKNGISSSGKQKYLCKKCGATICVGGKSNRMSWSDIKQIFILEQREGLSLRKIAKRLKFSPSTISENRKYWSNRLA